MSRDLSALLDHTNTVISIDPANDLATDTNGAALALANMRGVGFPVIAVVGPSNFTPTDANRVELEVEESEDGVTFTDVANANLTRTQADSLGVASSNTGCFAVVDATDRDDKIYSTTYLPTSGDITHIRVVANFTGTVTGGIPLAVILTQAHPADAATAQ